MEKIHFKKKDRDLFAALLSVLPGAGHIYKHHYLAGVGIMIGGNLLMILVTALLALATFGLAIILVPIAYVLGVAYAAYELEDWHGKHGYLHPWSGASSPKE
ncbi:hypothetical protein NT6N_32610 [Oceaniferula spumae]|uniref:TM2 domain-containing protein n=1 Tax=Oceaniferula spumae TaxID=2979115 RepID=A0AAT9FQQ4_9BACT